MICCSRISAEIHPLPDYQVGDRARADLISPARLLVYDPELTVEQRREELRKLPLVFRHCPDADIEAEAALRDDLARMRTKFLNALETNLSRRVLLPEELGTARFGRFLAGFLQRNKSFPLTTNLAYVWAEGQSDAAYTSVWAERLRLGAGALIRKDALPRDLPWNGLRIRLVSIPRHSPAPTLETVLQPEALTTPANLVGLSKARQDFRAGFAATEQALGSYLARFISENCLLEETLSREIRSRRSQEIWAAHHYQIGQWLLREGQIIDPQVWRALQELAQQNPPRSPTTASTGQPSTPPHPAWLGWIPQRLGPARTWLAAGLGMAGLGLSFFLLGWRLKNRRPSRLPVAYRSETTPALACPACAQPLLLTDAGGVESELWKQRALQAEQRAQTAVAMLRSNLVSGLADWVKGKVVRVLLGQQNDLRKSQHQAECEIQDLASRLAAVHAPLEERLKAYEARIAQLERELTLKGEENKQLIRARLQAARRQLSLEQNKSEAHWN